MSIDFTTMNGYQFEDYISNLFRQLGFEVEATNYSNDGGVDLIATFNQPIFSGKYIIQCKNWIGPVGQPEVRDLYGVVMDKRANKGILITPSDYTQQAYEFSEGKNIELINGRVLQFLIESKFQSSEINLSLDSNANYRNERYLYYQKNISEEPDNALNYIRMIEYLRGYVKQRDREMCCLELFDDIIKWTDKLIKKCFKASSKEPDRIMATMLKVEAFIHTGRLAEATEHLLRHNKFWIHTIAGDEHYNNIMCYSGSNYGGCILAWNLLAAFKHIGYKTGCDLIVSKLKMYGSWFEKNYYETGILGRLFIYPTPKMRVITKGKTEHFDMSVFEKNDVYDPTFFYDKFYTKPSEEYAQEIDEIFKLNGIV